MRVINAAIYSVVLLLCIDATISHSKDQGSTENRSTEEMDCYKIPDHFLISKCVQMKSVVEYFHTHKMNDYFPLNYNADVLKALDCIYLMNRGEVECKEANETSLVKYSFHLELYVWNVKNFSKEFRLSSKECGTPYYAQLEFGKHELWFIICYEEVGPIMGAVYEFHPPNTFKKVYSRYETLDQ